MTWQVNIIKNLGSNTVWCFPYNIPVPNQPPYPGFEVLENWLDENFNCFHRRLYNQGNPVLEVVFASKEDLFLFMLKKT